MLPGNKVVVLSGPICSGKSTLARLLEKKFGLKTYKSTDLVKSRIEPGPYARDHLQVMGRKLENEHGAGWICKDVLSLHGKIEGGFVLDSLRTKEQIRAFRDEYVRRVVHVHLSAGKESRRERWENKEGKMEGAFESYEDTQNDAVECRIDDLGLVSDVSIDTDRCCVEDVLERVSSLLGLYGRSYEKVVDVLVGGQYGSEGKGNIAAYLAPEYDYLVRVGGPNAGHKVKPSEGYVCTFHQLPSGSAHCAAKLVIGPGAVINPSILLSEIKEHKIDSERLFIDPQCMIITEKDRRGEKVLVDGISSTGSGTGMAAARRITHRGRQEEIQLAKDYSDFKPFIKESLEVFDSAFREGKKIFLEGTQGTGLSIYHGHYPYVTSRDTTVSGCLAEAGISSNRVRKVVMVCRTYPIRVDNSPTGKTSGPMSQEVTREDLAERSGLPVSELEELTSTTLKPRRIGEFDWCLLRKSTSLNAPTDIALTFADYITVKNSEARRFEQLSAGTISFIQEIERFTSSPVSLISTRFHHERSIIDRRSW